MAATIMRVESTVLAAAALLIPAFALACGACIEDKIAATYDHAIVTEAAARGERIVFGAIEGAVDAARASERIRERAPKVRGVQRASVRASAAPPAFSFALDARTQTPEAATAELERRLAMPGLRLTVIRVQ